MKTKTYRIAGTSPLMMHNVRLANPFDDHTKAIKAISGKRKKTEDDLAELARLEWHGGLYNEPDLGVYMPGYNIFAAVRDAGALHKLKTAFKRGALIQEDKIKLEYEGPAKVEALFCDKRFVDIRSVVVGTSKVMRCRPMFPSWALRFTVMFEESVLQQSEIDLLVASAGAMIGLGDYRPRFGRFEVLQ